jgi:hypothetical protein
VKRGRRIGVIVGLALVGSASAILAGLAGWYAVDRTAMVEGLCRVGLPNLSRPKGVDDFGLGCAVLGPKTRVTGYLMTSFENSTLILGEPVVDEARGVLRNEAAWLSGTDGIAQRGGEALERMLEPIPGLCGVAIAKITAEGWMTVSAGGFGHLNMNDREFYADRILSVRAPTEAELTALLGEPSSEPRPPGAEEFCRRAEQGEAF